MGTLRDITPSILALSSVLLEVNQLQLEPLDEDVRDTLDQCESTLLEGILIHAARAVTHTTEQKEG